jgi:hypothetical protein
VRARFVVSELPGWTGPAGKLKSNSSSRGGRLKNATVRCVLFSVKIECREPAVTVSWSLSARKAGKLALQLSAFPASEE